MTKKSVEFAWDLKDYDKMVDSCKYDDGVTNALPWITNKKMNILEAGCGTGRVMRYLYNKGYKNVFGIELNNKVVKEVKEKFPEMNIISGDILKMPYDDSTMDIVLCYGVVEHFPDLGLIPPLSAIKRVLKVGGVAIVTIPSLNLLRQLEYLIRDVKCMLTGTLSDYKRSKAKYLFRTFPRNGDFFEYRLSPTEFVKQCERSGFKVIKSIPISHLDGIYHIFGEKFIKYEKFRFYPTVVGKIMNNVFIKFPFFHNHMQCCILKKIK